MGQCVFFALLLVLAGLPASFCRVTTTEEVSVLEGRSVTIPCHYDPQYAGYVKYWCQGSIREFCSSLARSDAPGSTNSPEEKVTIFDDPVQQVFTVTIKDLKEADSGWYRCGLEVGGMWTADVTASVNLRVIHGMSVVNSRLTGEEGSSLSVECLYSERFRESEKKWCRSGDWSSCVVTGPEGRYAGATVEISDDKVGAFNIKLKELRKGDTGWYWCGAGQEKMAIHVMVTPRTTTTANPLKTSPTTDSVPQPNYIAKEDSANSHRHMLETVVVCVSLMAVVGMVILARRIWTQHRRERSAWQATELKSSLSQCSGEVGELQSASVIFLNKDTQQVQVF